MLRALLAESYVSGARNISRGRRNFTAGQSVETQVELHQNLSDPADAPTHSGPDFEALMCQYQQGEAGAATALVELLSPQLRRFFAIQIVSRRDADDLLQETWLRIHSARHTYRPGQPVLPWLYAIARHVRVDHYRRTRRREMGAQQLEQAMQPAGTPWPPGKTPDLEDLLAPLPDAQREVIAMLKLAGMSIEEVARATSSTIGSVKQKAHRAYEKLRDHLTRLGLGARPGDTP
jgi:RNA polymerase sigma-70 factor (ECF subfamily)